MKNVVTIMKELGFEIPEDKEQSVLEAMKGNYVTQAEHDKKVTKLTDERDSLKAQVEAAEKTLESFDGIDPKNYKETIAQYKQQAEDAKKDYDAKLAAKERDELIERAVANVKFTSAYARKDILSRLKAEDIKVKDGKLIGFNDYIEAYKESDPEAFGSEGEPAKFTKPGQNTKEQKVTRESILAIKDTAERQRAMAENHELFGV